MLTPDELPRKAQVWAAHADPDRRCIVHRITDAGVFGMYYRESRSTTRDRAIPLNTFLLDYRLLEDFPA